MMSSYNIPGHPVTVEEIIKQSQFTTRVRHVETAEAAKAFIRKMKQRFADATHHCWAYIVGHPQATTLIGCSDDGEPSGTAGKPMLKVLQHADIGDIVVVCTRYYGGTKLGTGGLTRAYGGGVKLALDALKVKPKINFTEVLFAARYAQLKDIQRLLSEFKHQALNVDYQIQIQFKVEIATAELAKFKVALRDKFKGQIEWTITDS